MDLSPIQNTYLRTGEVQSLVQQALYQAELAQKALARQVEKEAREKAAQVQDLSSSGAARPADVFEEKPKAAPSRQRIDLKA